jgi:hypothetical protein
MRRKARSKVGKRFSRHSMSLLETVAGGDLRPLCSDRPAVVHSRKPVYLIEAVKRIIKTMTGK